MITFLVVIISLGILIFFHEFGHFVFSKISKITVEEFGFGYPPRLIGLVKLKKTNKWKIFFGKKVPNEELSSTIYSLNLIPFGGFNKIKGEEGEIVSSDSFYGKSWWQRGISIIGGVLMNIFLAIILLSICFKIGIPLSIEKAKIEKNVQIKEVGIQVISVKKSSPADKAGIRLGDIILKIDGKEFKEEEEIKDYISKKINHEINLKIKRGKNEIELKVVPKPLKEIFSEEELTEDEKEKGGIGIVFSKVSLVSYPFHLAVLKGIEATFITFKKILIGVYLILKELILKRKMIGEVVGVVGIGTFIGEVYQVGFVYLLQFISLISIALAVTQLIPFPALDGGRLVFVLIEGMTKKQISRKTEAIIHNIGFTILLLLMIFITYRDLLRLGEKLFK